MTDPEFIDRVQDYAGGHQEPTTIDDLWALFGDGLERTDKQGLVDAMREDYGGEIPPDDVRVLVAAGYPAEPLPS